MSDWTRTSWQDSAGESFVVETTEASVPLCHDQPGSGAMALRLHRLPCARASQPPLLFLVGGPGEMAADWLRHPPFRSSLCRLGEHRHVVILDQRGNDWKVEPISPDGEFWEQPEAALRALEDQARRTLGASPDRDPRHINPWQSAQDLALLGLGEFDLLATSYGTHLAMASFKCGAPGLRRAVFLGFEGPDQTYKLPSRTDAQLGRLEAHLGVELRSQLADADWGARWIAASLIGTSNRWKGLAAHLQDPLAARPGFLKMLNRRSASFYLNDVASGASQCRSERIQREAESFVLGDFANFPFPQIGSAWRQEMLPDSFREPPRWDGPLLVVSGELDGFTPPENVADEGSGLTAMRKLRLPGVGHSDYLTSEAALDATLGFLAE